MPMRTAQDHYQRALEQLDEAEALAENDPTTAHLLTSFAHSRFAAATAAGSLAAQAAATAALEAVTHPQQAVILPRPVAEDEEFVLVPPVAWLNRVDEVLRHHGAATRDGSLLGRALGNLIRSWEGTAARDSSTAPGPEHWGPVAQVDRRQAPTGYDANPTVNSTDPAAYERYAARLDAEVPGWHEHDTARMSCELAELALARRGQGSTAGRPNLIEGDAE